MDNTAEEKIIETYKNLINDSQELKELKRNVEKPILPVDVADVIVWYETNHLNRGDKGNKTDLLALIINNEILHPDLSELENEVIYNFVCENDALNVLVNAVLFGYRVA